MACVLLFLKGEKLLLSLPAGDELQFILLKNHFEYYLISE